VLHYLLSHRQCSTVSRGHVVEAIRNNADHTHTLHSQRHWQAATHVDSLTLAHRRLTDCDWPPTHAVPCAMIETLAAGPGNRARWHQASSQAAHTHRHARSARWLNAGRRLAVWAVLGMCGWPAVIMERLNRHRRTDLTRPPHATPHTCTQLTPHIAAAGAALCIHSRRTSDTTFTSTDTEFRPN